MLSAEYKLITNCILIFKLFIKLTIGAFREVLKDIGRATYSSSSVLECRQSAQHYVPVCLRWDHA